MYEACFGFDRRPFASVPQVGQYFPAQPIETARLTLGRCIERGEGPGMVIGGSGTGKTLLCRMLAQQFCKTFAVAVLCSGRLSSRSALFQTILYELGRPYRGMNEGELRIALTDYLRACEDGLDVACSHDQTVHSKIHANRREVTAVDSKGLVLLVDEAHTLPLRLLEEIRMLTNLVCDCQPRVRLVLAGGPILEERFANPKLESFSQRLVARCYLEPFTQTETQQYVQAQIGAAGGHALQVFPADACQAVYRATDGVPRLINQVCDHALLLACAAGRTELRPRDIEEAWADLQQLPTRWTGEADETQSDHGVVEFGGLDDEPDENPDEEPNADQHLSPTDTPDVPPLRVTADDDHQDDDHQDVEPTEETEEAEPIEQTRGELDEEFQPAGSIHPEVELSFHDPEDPFGEQFEHEEVVVDRYRPSNPKDGPERTEPARANPLVELKRADWPGVAAARYDAGPETVPMYDPQTAAAAAAEPKDAEPKDEDMIIVEDACDQDDAPRTRRIVVARKQEFRQLFAKLRRG